MNGAGEGNRTLVSMQPYKSEQFLYFVTVLTCLTALTVVSSVVSVWLH